MSVITRTVRAYPIAFFTLLACLFGWALFIAAGLGAGGSPSNLPLGPIIAAAIVAAAMGRAEWRAWGRALIRFRAWWGWYTLAIVAPVVIIAVAVLANSAFGAPLPTPSQLAGWTGLLGSFAFMLLFVGIGEEAGWTAFAAPRLLTRYSFLTAWVILSIIRSFWHLPLMLTGDLPWVLGIGGNVGFQFLLLWIFLRGGGVWSIAALWHTVLNTAGGEFIFQMVQEANQARLGVLMTAGYLLLAAVVYFVDRRYLVRAHAG